VKLPTRFWYISEAVLLKYSPHDEAAAKPTKRMGTMVVVTFISEPFYTPTCTLVKAYIISLNRWFLTNQMQNYSMARSIKKELIKIYAYPLPQ
jgi:hypothetical protein